MEYLHESRIENSYFCGGRYNLFFPFAYIKRWRKKYTEVHELVNSPNLIWSFGKPEVHMRSRDIEKLFLETINRVNPDIIHFHELESLTGALLPMTRELRIPYLVDIHNYWFLCPQRDLMDEDRTVCTDWEDGVKCASCRVLPSSTRAGWMFIGYVKNTPCGRLLDTITSWRYKKRVKREFSTPPAPDTKNIPLYRARRNFFLAELNMADALIFPSKRARELYRSYGVANPNSLTILPVNKNYSTIKRKNPRANRKKGLTFGYLGGVLPQKGIHILLEAFGRVIRQAGDNVHLAIYGAGENVYEEELKRKAVRNVSFKGRYSQDSINEVMEGIDVAVVPSLWEDCSPIVLNELRLSGTPIIGSRIGGIEEAIEHGATGYLFEPGNAEELAHFMKLFVDTPEMLGNFMKKINFSFDMDAYMEKIKETYRTAYGNSRHGQEKI